MYLTFKAKIITDKETEAILNNICFSATKLYNTVNYYLRSEWNASRAEYEMNLTQYRNYEHHFGYDLLPYEKPKIPLNRTELQSRFKDNHWAKNLHSQSAQFVVYEVINAYKSWFALRKSGRFRRNVDNTANGDQDANPPKFRPKTSLSPVTFLQEAPTISSKNGSTHLRLSLGSKREDGVKEITVKITHRNSLPDSSVLNENGAKGTLKNVRITYDTVSGRPQKYGTAPGTYYAHLVFDVPADLHQLQLFPTNVVAVDLGLNNIITATFSDGTTLIISGRELKAIKRYWQKVRAKVKPPSVTKRKPSRRYLQISRKESRQIRHRLHIISKEFVKMCEEKGVTHIVIGNLTGIRDKIKYSKRINQQLHNWNFAQLVDFITYKAQRLGIAVERISERYTSQTCCACGTVDKNNRKTRGLYVCSCGNRINADRNGANNILTRYLRYRSSGSVALPVVTLVLSRTDAQCLRTYKHSVAHKAA